MAKAYSEYGKQTFQAEIHTSSPLVIQWIVDNDTLEVCRRGDKEVHNKITQLASFSLVASVCEALGLFASFTMGISILLKTIWAKIRQQWNNKIDEEDQERSLD